MTVPFHQPLTTSCCCEVMEIELSIDAAKTYSYLLLQLTTIAIIADMSSWRHVGFQRVLLIEKIMMGPGDGGQSSIPFTPSRQTERRADGQTIRAIERQTNEE